MMGDCRRGRRTTEDEKAHDCVSLCVRSRSSYSVGREVTTHIVWVQQWANGIQICNTAELFGGREDKDEGGERARLELATVRDVSIEIEVWEPASQFLSLTGKLASQPANFCRGGELRDPNLY